MKHHDHMQHRKEGFILLTGQYHSPSLKGIVSGVQARQESETRNLCREVLLGGVLHPALCLNSGHSTSQLLLFLVVIPYYWHLQKVWGSWCNCTSIAPIVSLELASVAQILTHGTEHQLLSMTLSAVHFYGTEAAPSPIVSSSTKFQLLFTAPLYLQN